MYCPDCGNMVDDDASFCSRCGRMLTVNSQTYYDASGRYSVTSTTTSTYQPYPAPAKKRTKPGVYALVIFIVAIVVAAALFIPVEETKKGELEGSGFVRPLALTTTYDSEDARALVPLEGFASKNATLSFVDNDRTSEYKVAKNPRLGLSKDISSKFDEYEWTIKGVNDGSPLIKKEPFVTLYTTSFGVIEVKVVCKNDSLGLYETYEFKYEIVHVADLEWKFEGATFKLQKMVPMDKVKPYTPSTESEKKARDVTDWSRCTDFVVTDPLTVSFAEDLSGMYLQAFGRAAEGQQFAEFVLAFVQYSFDYVSDMNNYGMDEYFAYPAETLMNGSGDCEDTSILCSALWKACGYKVALVVLPSHMASAVAIEDYKKPSGYVAEHVWETFGTTTYYAAETTVDSYYPLGLLQKGTNYRENSHKGVVGQGSYGFYEVKA